jgi:predicted lipoprotein with Yx(FWY)xxD motif
MQSVIHPRRGAQLRRAIAATTLLCVAIGGPAVAAKRSTKRTKRVATTEAPDTTSAPAPTAAPTTAAPTPSMKLAKTAVGEAWVDTKGLTLYMFEPDKGSGSSVCYDQCAKAWPPFTVKAASDLVLPAEISASAVKLHARKDGTQQVVVNGWPLYYWFADKAPGDITGQSVGDVWWVVDKSGTPIRTVPTIKLGQNSLGSTLVDGKGLTLYQFDPDKQSGVSVCYDQCATAWPPLIVGSEKDLLIFQGSGINTSKLKLSPRKDGALQVSYDGWPLYRWFLDKAPGDNSGQAVNQVWWVMDKDGNVLRNRPTIMFGNTSNRALGSVLLAGDGYSLYMYSRDSITLPRTNCYDACATAWPPLVVKDAKEIVLTKGGGVDPALVKLVPRLDGSGLQVTYNGWPLYKWQRDTKPGDVTGQAVGNVWYVLDTEGKPKVT